METNKIAAGSGEAAGLKGDPSKEEGTLLRPLKKN